MRYPIIETATSTVVSVIMLDNVNDWIPPSGHTIGAAGGEIGDTWDGSQYIKQLPQNVTITPSDINAEWDNRVFSGFSFNGKVYASDRDSIDNITGAVTWARQAISDGVEAGNLHWNAVDPLNPGQSDLPFAWKAADGTFVQMDAPTVVQFGIALARHKQKMFLCAQALKAMDPIPDDYASDIYWT